MKKIKRVFSFLFVCFFSFLLTGCQSTDKTKAYMSTGDNFVYVCTYDSSNDDTIVDIKTIVENDTIYTIENISLTIDLYNSDNIIKSNYTNIFDYEIKYGVTAAVNLRFIYDNGKIDKIRFVKWSASYKSIWDSYHTWILSTLIVAIVLSIVLIIIMIIADWDLDDLVEHFYLFFILLIPYIYTLVDGIKTGIWSWMPPVIISCGIVVILIACGIIGFIKEAL